MENSENQESKATIRHTPEVREKLLGSYRGSGLTQKKWCEQSGVKLSTLAYWLKREREQADGYSLVAVQSSCEEARVRINGVELAFEGETGVSLLAALVRELGS